MSRRPASWLVAPLLLSVASCVVARPKTAFNPAVFPEGRGWYCYAGRDNDGDCKRSDAECEVERTRDRNARMPSCRAYEAAHCFYVRNGSDPWTLCYPSETACSFQSDFQSRSNQASTCGQVL